MEIQNREAWLTEAVERITPLLVESGMKARPVRISVGWPSARGTSEKNRVVGQCWPTTASTDRVAQLFISPMLSNSVDILGIVTHELVHAFDNCKSGHRGPFVKHCKAVGLLGPWTATSVGPELKATFKQWVEEMGKFPSGAITRKAQEEKKQTTRMLKVECDDCGCVVRMTRKWLDEVGPPTCACTGQMTEICA